LRRMPSKRKLRRRGLESWPFVGDWGWHETCFTCWCAVGTRAVPLVNEPALIPAEKVAA
jgi:hypothetical protein